MYRKNGWKALKEGEMAQLEAFAEKYKAYLDAGKTERECVTESVRQAKAAGFEDLNAVIKSGKQLKAGDRVYCNWMNKSFVNFSVIYEIYKAVQIAQILFNGCLAFFVLKHTLFKISQ